MPKWSLTAEEWPGHHAIWQLKTRRHTVKLIVRVLDAQMRFGRLDCLVETNAGSRVWVGSTTLEPIMDPLDEKNRGGKKR